MTETEGQTTDTALLARIRGFEIDPPGQPGAFQARLAAETGWAAADARAAIAEYRRFLYLAAVSPNGATPSRKIDEVWHEHLLFTRNYQRMCKEAVGRMLHHDPGTSDGDEQRYRALYLETLARYEREFGEPPPESHWPRPRSQPAKRDAARRPRSSQRLGPISFGAGTTISFAGISMASTFTGLVIAIAVGLAGSLILGGLFGGIADADRPQKPQGRPGKEGRDSSSGGDGGGPVFASGSCGGGGSDGGSGGDGGSCGGGGGCGGGCGG